MATVKKDDGLRDLKRPSRSDLGAGGRMVKLFRAECQTNRKTGFIGCQDPTKVHPNWRETCPHDPYFRDVERKEIRTKYEDELVDGKPTGRRLVTGTETVVWHERIPNLVQAALSVRINNGMGPTWHLERDSIKPEDHPNDPHKPFCEYRDCFSQDLKYHTPHGNYCSEMQAKIVMADELEKRLEIVNPQKRREQLAAISVR